MRITGNTLQLGDFPAAIGACANDFRTIAKFANRSQRNLIDCGGDSGWWNGWQRIAFPLSPLFPYFTLPREFSRAIGLDVCGFPLQIQNEFWEFLPQGLGIQNRREWEQLNNTPDWWCRNGALQGFERGGAWPSHRDLFPVNQYIKAYITNPLDAGKRILIGPAWDENGNEIYTLDGNNQVNGFYMTLGSPSVTSQMIVSRFTGLQKDSTYGAVVLKQLDANTGTEITLSRYAPDETIPAYRRYYINSLPRIQTCPQSPCVIPDPPAGGPVPEPRRVTVTALVKLSYIPMLLPTDFLIISCENALIEEAKRCRYMDMDAPTAPQMAAVSHANAIKMLQNELRTYLGEYNPATNFAPFGTARLERPLRAIRFG